MTIATVMPPSPRELPDTGGATPPAGSAAGGFGSVMAQHLAAHAVTGEAPTGQPAPELSGGAADKLLASTAGADEAAEPAAATDEDVQDLVTEVAVALAAMGRAPASSVVASSVAVSTSAGGATTASSPVPGAEAGTAAAPGTALEEDTPVDADLGADERAVPSRPTPERAGSGPAGPATPSVSPSVSPSATPPSTTSSGPADPVAAGVSASPPVSTKIVSEAESPPAPQQPTVTAATPTAAAGAPTAASVAGNGSAVTAQVFPVIPALVTRGEGTHTITLRLHPADLGEVHVNVTVKQGVVDVTISAGAEAQQALRSGSGELRTLLDLAGAATGQLVVRDLPSGTAPVPSTVGNQIGLADHGTGQGASGDVAGDGPSGDRSPRRSRPGGSDLDAGATQPPPPPNRDRPAAGLDLTI